MMLSIFVSCSKGLEYLLKDELESLGVVTTKINPQGIYAEVDTTLLYQICLWSRLASRVHLILFSGPAKDKTALYTLCRQYDWQTMFSVDKTFAVMFHGESPAFRHTVFGAQTIKDAVVDYFRDVLQKRPTVDKHQPNILIQAYLKHDQITVSLDMTGYSLHQRGYRLEAGIAPLKEHIAAAMLIRGGWPHLLKEGYAFHDPFCGSGTLVIEAAMMAANLAPGLIRTDQAFQHWRGHEDSLWQSLKTKARAEVVVPDVRILGTDIHANLLQRAQHNAARAGVIEWVEWDAMSIEEAQAIQDKGLIVTNPPYGIRMGEESELVPLYQTFGQVLAAHYSGWQVCVLSPSVLLAKAIGLRSHKQYKIVNGAVDCQLFCFNVDGNNQFVADSKPKIRFSDNAQMFVNRLKKNHQHLQKWAKRAEVACYRLYDADLPEYAFAIDIYQDEVVIQEYAPPASIDPKLAESRCQEAILAVCEVLQCDRNHVFLKQRKRQKGLKQYEKLAVEQKKIVVKEGPALFHVNLTDYLDTGLFLDHRLMRLRLGQLKPGMRLLNCFCYTATASVHAALAGVNTVNVDLSNTYLAWGLENFKLNGLDGREHAFIAADCMEWLSEATDQFDVIFLDPPSFSNSKRMQGVLDIQRDHVFLIQNAMRLLAASGSLYFSTNLRSFKLSDEISAQFQVQDISTATIDVDFKRNSKIHQCFLIQFKSGS